MRTQISKASARLLASVLAGAALTGCADSVTPPSAGLSLDAPATLGASYKLGIGDKLKVSVFGEDSLSGQVEVNAAGHVTLPLAGEVPAKGRTIAEFRDIVTRRLSEGYLNNPKVSVEVANYRPIYVHGEVRNGGEFPYRNAITLRDAVALAGGYTYRADHSYVLLARNGQDETKVAASGSLTVLPGDNITIPERFF